MAADEQAAASKPMRTPESILELPDERFFKEGGCHALALELAAAFSGVGMTPKFFYLPSRDHEALAEHVVVKCGDGFFDVDFGPQSESEILARWANKAAGKLLLVGHPGWISCRSEINEHKSYLGLHIEALWLDQARDRAKVFIEKHKERFGL